MARERVAEVAERCLARCGHAQRALDLAGGHGEYGLALADRGLDVTLQDLPQVIDVVASRSCASADRSRRCSRCRCSPPAILLADRP